MRAQRGIGAARNDEKDGNERETEHRSYSITAAQQIGQGPAVTNPRRSPSGSRKQMLVLTWFQSTSSDQFSRISLTFAVNWSASAPSISR